MKTCDITNCGNIHYGKGLCVKHYKKTPRYVIYSAWRNMHQRCENPTYKFYKDYGGRGIKVCERWSGEKGLANFIEDMSPKTTPKHTLDRKNGNGDYEPDNVRWATPTEQNHNMRLRRDNTSGAKGVDFDKRSNKWRARIKSHGVDTHIGYFKTKEQAILARKDFERRYGYTTTTVSG